MRRELVYPTLLSCADTLSNSFWKAQLTELAYNNCPPGSYISNGTLTSAAFAWEIPGSSDDPDSMAAVTQELVDLMQEHLGLFSEEDTAEQQEHFYQVLASKAPSDTPENWPELKKIYGKELPLASFVSKIYADRTGFDDIAMARRTIADINLGMGLKTIGNDDIVVKDGMIVAIPPIDLFLDGY